MKQFLLLSSLVLSFSAHSNTEKNCQIQIPNTLLSEWTDAIRSSGLDVAEEIKGQDSFWKTMNKLTLYKVHNDFEDGRRFREGLPSILIQHRDRSEEIMSRIGFNKYLQERSNFASVLILDKAECRTYPVDNNTKMNSSCDYNVRAIFDVSGKKTSYKYKHIDCFLSFDLKWYCDKELLSEKTEPLNVPSTESLVNFSTTLDAMKKECGN